MGEKKDKENMVKKRTQILDSGGLALPYFLFPQSFVVICMGLPKSILIIRLKKKVLILLGWCLIIWRVKKYSVW